MSQPRQNGKFAPKSPQIAAANGVPIATLPASTRAKSRHEIVTCSPASVPDVLDNMGEHELLSMCAYQKGIGFGSSIEVLLAFRIKG
jgi:hypothetical protein